MVEWKWSFWTGQLLKILLLLGQYNVVMKLNGLLAKEENN